MIQALSAALAIICLGLWLRWRRSKLDYFRRLGIPGPEPGVFFGNMWEMYMKDPVTCKREWIHKYGKILGYYYGLEPVLLVADVEIMKQVLVRDFNAFTERPFRLFNLRDEKDQQAPNLVNHKGQRWKEVRSLLTPAFTTGKLKKMTPLISSALEVLLDKIEENAKSGEEFEIYGLYKALTMDVIGRTAFGIEANVQENPDNALLRTAKAIFSGRFKSLFVVFAFSFQELRFLFLQIANLRLMGRNKGVNPVLELLQTCNDVIQLRRGDPSLRRPDLLQTLIDARSTEESRDIKASDLTASVEAEEAVNGDSDMHSDDQEKGPSKKNGVPKQARQLSDKEITGNSLMFFLAGYETTSTALAFITHVLVNRTDEQDKLRAEIKEKIGNEEVDYDSVQQLPYMDRFIMECLRIYPPIYSFVNRVSNREVKLGKWRLPKGSTVQIPVHYLHHDPELWPQPDRFDPDRFLPENRSVLHSMIWQPFGAGPRNCIGMRFALLEIKLALVRILKRYSFQPCDKTEKEDELQMRVSVATLHPENGIHVRAKPVDL